MSNCKIEAAMMTFTTMLIVMAIAAAVSLMFDNTI
jgi:hypothetical protein